VWEPKGEQEARLAGKPASVINGDIVLAKLAHGQIIEFEAHAVKGVGKDHAKFSPVATAFYKLRTNITFPEGHFTGKEAEKLVDTCPMGVFDIEELGGAIKGGSSKGASCCSVLLHSPATAFSPPFRLILAQSSPPTLCC